jgi:sensor histidine kinase YesM
MMNTGKYRSGLIKVQVLIWAAVLLLIFFSLLPMDGYLKSIIYTLINSASYAVIIYGNILVLYPLFYQKGRHVWYVLTVASFLIVTGVLRGYATLFFYQRYLGLKPAPVHLLNLLGYVPGGVLVFLLSLIFRIAIAYFNLKQQTEEIILQKSQAELNLLKSQVQPHFLFNTLNNIYYEAYKVDRHTARLIERLADIMRYFVDESPKHDVLLTTEVAFIENYLELEKIRIPHGVIIDFQKSLNRELRIPPMLLMTFVENIFKHGIDKSSSENQVAISLIQQDGYLLFNTRNRIFEPPVSEQSTGFGIINLTKRLHMLYGSNFELSIRQYGHTYHAFLKIPIA